MSLVSLMLVTLPFIATFSTTGYDFLSTLFSVSCFFIFTFVWHIIFSLRLLALSWSLDYFCFHCWPELTVNEYSAFYNLRALPNAIGFYVAHTNKGAFMDRWFDTLHDWRGNWCYAWGGWKILAPCDFSIMTSFVFDSIYLVLAFSWGT